jgi:putative glycosyltransferase
VKVSIVTTLYQSAPYVEEFFRRSVDAVAPVADEIEVVFVDDGSPDNAAQLVRKLSSERATVRLVELSRNFGHFPAVVAGLAHTDGDLVYLIDCDLEEAPELFDELYAPLRDAPVDDPVDMAFGVARERTGDFVRRIGGAGFYRLINALSRVEVPVNAAMARVMTRRYVNAFLQHHERELFLSGLMTITGFRQVAVPIDKPGKGTTTYSPFHRLNVGLQAVTAFSDKPLTLIFVVGVSLSILAVLATLYIVISVVAFDVDYLSGWASMIAAICFFSGLILASLGVVGFYVGRIFVEVKDRPTIIKAVTELPAGDVSASRAAAMPPVAGTALRSPGSSA